MKINLFSLMKF